MNSDPIRNHPAPPPRAKLRARFAPKTRFRPEPAALARGRPEAELDRLKQRLLAALLAQTAEPELHPPLCRAAGEAASLAWLTPFPLLVLPLLLEEKAATARHQAHRQRTILCRGGGSWSQAA